MRILLFLASLISLTSLVVWATPGTVLFEDGFELGGLGSWSNVQPTTDPQLLWTQQIEPTLLTSCGTCHLGSRFGIATLERSGATITAQESQKNRETFLRQISLDNPKSSRLLAKVLPASHPLSVDHGGGSLLAEGDALHQTLLGWIEAEKFANCTDCGSTAPEAWIAYVDQPAEHWAIPREPDRPDWGLRVGATLKMQPINAATLVPSGPAFDFLPPSFCVTNDCDFGHMSASYQGDRLAFECRRPVSGETAFDQSWNLCIAEIGPDGRAQSPRFLLPEERRHVGSTQSRVSPFGLYEDGEALRGQYDIHFMTRRLNDQHPTFSPDGQRVFFSTRGPDPIKGVHASRTYHGFEHINHIVGFSLSSGPQWTRPYLNEGGVADFPLFLQNGRLGFHTWNLERTDRHMYQQVRLDGNGTLPVLFGRLQGTNQWAKFTQLNNGFLLGITGRRRAQLERFVPFVADHTLGTGPNINPTLNNFEVFDQAVDNQIVEFGFCEDPPGGANCRLDRYYQDVSWSPDGRALVAYAPSGVFTHTGHDMYRDYGTGETTEQRLASLAPFLPSDLGIGLIDHNGVAETLLAPPAGRSFRYPAWVGKRSPPVLDPSVESTDNTAVLHIADVPVWFSFDTQDSGFSDNFKSGLIDELDRIVALRVLVKDLSGNACTSDSFAYRHAVFDDQYDHPTHLGIYNSTGYTQLLDSNGTLVGDVLLESDRSAYLRLPADELLLFQGVDSAGHVVAQKSRLFSLSGGTDEDVGVKRNEYRAQCGICHGAIEDPESFRDLTQVDQLASGALDQNTDARAGAPVDLAQHLSRIGVTTRWLTFRHTIRPVLDAKCVSCHSGALPAAELNLSATYSATANYPAGKWATDGDLSSAEYLAWVPENKRVPGYDWSVSYDWYLQRADSEYQNAPEYASLRTEHAPIGDLAPWDSGYQSLHAKSGNGNLLYLSFDTNPGHMGRSATLGGNSSSSYLLEVLTGENLVEEKTYVGFDHTGLLNEQEEALVKAVIDIGFPYMSRCDDRVVPSGPNAGKFWGDPAPP